MWGGDGNRRVCGHHALRCMDTEYILLCRRIQATDALLHRAVVQLEREVYTPLMRSQALGVHVPAAIRATSYAVLDGSTGAGFHSGLQSAFDAVVLDATRATVRTLWNGLNEAQHACREMVGLLTERIRAMLDEEATDIRLEAPEPVSAWPPVRSIQDGYKRLLTTSAP